MHCMSPSLELQVPAPAAAAAQEKGLNEAHPQFCNQGTFPERQTSAQLNKGVAT